MIVPDSTPVVRFSVRPGGSLPLASANVAFGSPAGMLRRVGVAVGLPDRRVVRRSVRGERRSRGVRRHRWRSGQVGQRGLRPASGRYFDHVVAGQHSAMNTLPAASSATPLGFCSPLPTEIGVPPPAASSSTWLAPVFGDEHVALGVDGQALRAVQAAGHRGLRPVRLNLDHARRRPYGPETNTSPWLSTARAGRLHEVGPASVI